MNTVMVDWGLKVIMKSKRYSNAKARIYRLWEKHVHIK